MIHRMQIRYLSAQSKGYTLRVIGVPKTIDNDLVTTDHCPGYGSVVKYCAPWLRAALDHEAMGQHDLVSIIEVMGRMPAGSPLVSLAKAKRIPMMLSFDHLPELPSLRTNLLMMQTVLKRNRYCWLWLAKDWSIRTEIMLPIPHLVRMHLATATVVWEISSPILLSKTLL